MSSLLAMLVVALFSWPSLWARGPAANRDGNQAYRKGDYDRALADYRKAQEILPGERILNYNSGTALLGGKKPEEAVQSLMSAAGDPRREVQSRALYNAGNALASANKFEEALGTYRQAVLADPKNLDAKFNYELTKRRLAQQQKDNQKNDKNDKNDKNKDQKDKNQKQDQNQGKDEDKKDDSQQKQDQQKDQQEDPKSGESQKPPEEQNPAPADSGGTPQPAGLLSRQEAERLLDALKDNEVKQLKERLKSRRKKNVEKDW